MSRRRTSRQSDEPTTVPAKTCPRCGEREDQGWLCHGCTRHLRNTLRAIRNDWPDLMDAFTRARGIQLDSEGHGTTLHGPLPFDEQAAEVSRHIRAVLVSWSMVTVEDFHATCPPDRIAAMVGHLIAWLPTIRKHVWALELSDEVDDLHAWLLGALQRGEGRLVTLQRASCPDCGGPLTARVGLDWSRNPRIRCRGTDCGREWGADAWDELMAASQRRDDAIPEEPTLPDFTADWATAEWIASAMALSVGAVRTAAWRHGWQRRLAGGTADGRTVLYLLADAGEWWRRRAERRTVAGT
jgi:ribosomal protein S27AE